MPVALPPAYLHCIEAPGGTRLWVTDLAKAAQVQPGHDLVISLLNPGTELYWSHPRHHIFHFADVVEEEDDSATEADMAAILAVDLAGAKSVLVHCHGGYSRSPAVAMVLARKLGAGLPAIDTGIDWSWADPNRHLLAMGERLLGIGRELSELARRRIG